MCFHSNQDALSWITCGECGTANVEGREGTHWSCADCQEITGITSVHLEDQ
jgi:hypothetical protein